MSAADAALRYQSQAVQTAPGPQLLVMLYDRLAADIDIADRAAGMLDFERVNDRLQHAQQIVRMLRHHLRPDGFAGGRDLLALYDFLERHLVGANLVKNQTTIRECAQIVQPLREAFRRAVCSPEETDGPPVLG